MQLMTLNINEIINPNNPFHLSNTKPSKSLMESLKIFGIISPPTAFNIKGEYYLFDGNKRISILQKLNIDKIKCLVIKTDSLKSAFPIFLEKKFPTPPVSCIIKSRGYKSIIEIFKNIPDNARLKLGLPKNKNDIQLIEILITLDKVTADFLESADISLKQIRPLMRLGIEKTTYFINKLAIPLSLNTNKFSKALEILSDIEIAGNNTNDLMDSFISKKEFTDENKTNIREDFFIYIDKIRRPTLNKNMKEFSIISEELLGNKIRVNPFNFENNKISFSFEANNSKQAISLIQSLYNSTNNKNFNELFKKI